MNGFEQYGEAMLLAHQGNSQIAKALAGVLKSLVERLRGYVGAMPTTLPPTESFQPK